MSVFRDEVEELEQRLPVAEIWRLGRSRLWPPGRNEPCWCGSGATYKRCCGAPGRAR